MLIGLLKLLRRHLRDVCHLDSQSGLLLVVELYIRGIPYIYDHA
jgi:hypothetical protein